MCRNLPCIESEKKETWLVYSCPYLLHVLPAGLPADVCPLAVTCAQYNRAAVEASFASGAEVDEDGLEDAFELVAEVPEKLRWGAIDHHSL
jgi:hypothetical protein